jgi:hypothetical protein
MKDTLTTNQAAQILLADEYANWSRAGAHALIEYFEDFEEDMGEEIEFDAVALRCDFSEYASLEDWCSEYFGQSMGDLPPAEVMVYLQESYVDTVADAIRQYIIENGTLIEFSGGVIVSSF